MYKVSVVVVVYNTEKYLGQCLDSIFAQTLDGVELVVVDNASNEATRRVLAEKIAGRDNVVCRLLEENVGGATGVTVGMRAASGEYLYTMDSDDIVPPGALEALYRAAKKDDSDVVIGRAISIMGERLQRMRFAMDEITWARELTVDSLEERPSLMVAPFYWGKLYRREFMERHDIRMQDGVLNADRYMVTNALRLSEKTTVIRDVCCVWRRFPDGRSVTGSARELASIRDRMASLTDTAMLFPEGELRQYALVSNLARVFLPVKSLSRPEIREEYSRLIKDYLGLTDESAVTGSTVLPVKYKAYAWLARRDRFDDIIALAGSRFRSAKAKEMGVPEDILRQPTLTRFDSVSAYAEDGVLKARCRWKDTGKCPPVALALLTGEEAQTAVNEVCRPEWTRGDGELTLSAPLSEETIIALARQNRPDRLFLECGSGDSVFVAEVPLQEKTLTALAARLPASAAVNPRRAARACALLRRLSPLLALGRKVKTKLMK